MEATVGREIDRQRLDMIAPQFVIGDRVLLVASRQPGTVLRVLSKDLESTGDPTSGPRMYAYDVMLDLDGSVLTVYECIAPLDETARAEEV